MPFFRFALVSCAIFSVVSASAAVRLGRFWRAKAKPCQEALAPAPALASPELPYLNLLRPHRTFEGDVMVDRTAVAEWRTEKYKRMTYEVFGDADVRDAQIGKIAEAAVTFLRWGGVFNEDIRLTQTPTGNLTLDLPVGAPSAAFVLMLEQRLTENAAAVPGVTEAERRKVRNWLLTQSLFQNDLHEVAGDALEAQRQAEVRDLPQEMLDLPRVYASRVFFAGLGPWQREGQEWVAAHGRVRVRLAPAQNLIVVETEGPGALDRASAEEVVWVMVRYDESPADVVFEPNGEGVRVRVPFDRRGLRSLSLMRARLLQGDRRPLRFKWPFITDAQAAEFERWSRQQPANQIAFPRDAAE